MYLLDTNAISERVAPKPHPAVVRWFDEADVDTLYISVLTLGEIRKGVEQMDTGKRKVKLIAWLDHALPGQFDTRILPVDEEVADCWGRLVASFRHPFSLMDSLIAATALVHGLRVVTRNVKDFARFDVEILDLWQAAS